MTSIQDISRVVLIGAGATLVMDGWLWLLRRLGVPTLNFALIGRWVGHLLHGRFRHAPIGAAAAVPGELALGWLIHYGTGIVFAALLVGLQGLGWARQPTLVPALVWGAATVLAPLFVMQPAMGAGIASSKTRAPLKNCLRSLANHLVFGLGIYLSAAVLSRL